jgi:polyprenyl P-hydroxybenzoate/phenylacrylic acid decarboxylase-like protein
MPQATPKRFVLGVSGASGAAYALRTLELLLDSGAAVHLVVTDYGKRLLAAETAVSRITPQDLLAHLSAEDPPPGLRCRREPLDAAVMQDWAKRLTIHPNKDVGALIASGSFLHDGMVIAPCSSSSLGSMAAGSGSNLLTRAAAVTLKERRPLIICHREMPLSLIDIENLRTLALAGATLCSPNPGFYLEPQSIADVVDFTVGKILDLLGVPHTLNTRWQG